MIKIIRNKRRKKYNPIYEINPIYDIDVYLIEKTNELIKRIEDMQEDIKLVRKIKEIERER